jgi:hypothetical protein
MSEKDRRLIEAFKEKLNFWWIPVTVMIAGFGLLFGEMRGIEARLDERIRQNEQQWARQSARSDQLYTMFIDLLKQRNGGWYVCGDWIRHIHVHICLHLSRLKKLWEFIRTTALTGSLKECAKTSMR